jgi:N-acetylglucosamine-6-phosphate deacetylase
VAAEIPGMPEFVGELAGRGIAVSLGHQLAKSPADVAPCIEAGARAFTHLGNGIPNEINRHDNIVYTALVEDRAAVMFIPDGHHLPDTMLRLYFRAVPLKRLVAVSDAQYPAGMPPGEYKVCGADARLEPSGLLWNPARNCLVGATTPMARMMELLRERIGVSEQECAAVGRENPLRLIGLS